MVKSRYRNGVAFLYQKYAFARWFKERTSHEHCRRDLRQMKFYSVFRHPTTDTSTSNTLGRIFNRNKSERGLLRILMIETNETGIMC
ncbi:unnamed protein product [Rhizophagus irregularis]|nr:unnamed protein product [Rhizophagus irregularis]